MRARLALASLLAVLPSLAGCYATQEEIRAEAAASALTNPVRFAVIGDFGQAGPAERDVATLVRSWSPQLVITTGDNNYDDGAASTIDANVGQYYAPFIAPYFGSYGAGATANAFFPSLGNHDWVAAGAAPYLAYFTLPGNERYYDFVRGPVHFFALDSDAREPDGVSSTSAQAAWLRSRLAASTARWKVVYFHHAPYSSGAVHGGTAWMRWPFQAWGASIVFSGHEHAYERLDLNGFPYFVNGAGGKSLYSFGPPIAGSQLRFSANYGAQLVEADATTMIVRFFDRSGRLVDVLTLGGGATTSRSFQRGADGYAGARDTTLREAAPTTVLGAAPTVYVDGDDPPGTGKDLVTLLRFDVSSIPAGSRVRAATLTLVATNASAQAYELYEARRAWSEPSATWLLAATGVAWEVPGARGATDRGATVLGAVSPNAVGAHTITFNSAGLALLQRWVDTPSSNRGLILADGANTDGADLRAREDATVALRPKLVITLE